MVWHRAVQAHPAEPAIGEIKMNLLAKLSFLARDKQRENRVNQRENPGWGPVRA